MVITVNCDSFPYRIQFEGSIEVARIDSGDIAVRLASDDAVIRGIELDEAEIERRAEVMREIMRRMNEPQEMFAKLSRRYVESQAGKMGGCAIRAGYD